MPSSARQIPNGRAVNSCVNFDQNSSPDMRAFALDSELAAVGEDQARQAIQQRCRATSFRACCRGLIQSLVQEYSNGGIEAEKRGTNMGTPETSPAFHKQSNRSPVNRTFSGSVAGGMIPGNCALSTAVDSLLTCIGPQLM